MGKRGLAGFGSVIYLLIQKQTYQEAETGVIAVLVLEHPDSGFSFVLFCFVFIKKSVSSSFKKWGLKQNEESKQNMQAVSNCLVRNELVYTFQCS